MEKHKKSQKIVYDKHLKNAHTLNLRKNICTNVQIFLNNFTFLTEARSVNAVSSFHYSLVIAFKMSFPLFHIFSMWPSVINCCDN